MGRRSTIFDDVMKAPWPVGVVLAAVVFVAFQVYQIFGPQDPLGMVFRSFVRALAYFFIFMFLLASLFSFLWQLKRGSRFKATKSIADIRALSWRQFESFVGEAFRQQGFFVLETPEGPDNGVDLVLRKDGEKTYVQCKHWKTNHVGVEKVRELLGSMAASGAEAGIFVTTGTYTQPARDLARECGIRLIDGVQLAQLLAKNEQTESISVAPAGLELESACPLCNAPMVKRVAQRGKNKGNPFWGCSKYPRCHGIRNVTS